MLFKPELNETAKAAGERVARVASRARRRTVSIAITLVILGGLGYIGWTSFQQKQVVNRPGSRPDLPVPVLAATPRVQDMPVYLDGVGAAGRDEHGRLAVRLREVRGDDGAALGVGPVGPVAQRRVKRAA